MPGSITYAPGVCNIGPREQAVRRIGGWLMLAATAGLWVFFVLQGTPPAWRLTLFLPATAGAVTLLEAYAHFCVVYGVLGLFNVGGGLRRRDRVWREEFRRKDRQKAIQLLALGVAIGAAVAGAAYLSAL